MVMIKDNHIAAAGGIAQAVQATEVRAPAASGACWRQLPGGARRLIAAGGSPCATAAPAAVAAGVHAQQGHPAAGGGGDADPGGAAAGGWAADGQRHIATCARPCTRPCTRAAATPRRRWRPCLPAGAGHSGRRGGQRRQRQHGHENHAGQHDQAGCQPARWAHALQLGCKPLDARACRACRALQPALTMRHVPVPPARAPQPAWTSARCARRCS